MGKNAKQVTCKRDCERDLRATMPRAASSVGVGRRVKRETALVSYNQSMEFENINYLKFEDTGKITER